MAADGLCAAGDVDDGKRAVPHGDTVPDEIPLGVRIPMPQRRRHSFEDNGILQLEWRGEGTRLSGDSTRGESLRLRRRRRASPPLAGGGSS